MIDLSIVILAHENYIIPYLDRLELIIKQYSTELILINETVISPNLPYTYRIIELDHRKQDFLPFVMSSCNADRILMLETDMELSKSLVDFILCSLQENSPNNISCVVKSYLTSSLESTYEHRITLLYHRNSNGLVDHYENESLYDYSLLHCTLDRFPFYVKRFIRNNDIRPLLIWFEDFCKQIDSNEIDQCYTLLEQLKRLEGDQWEEFELNYKAQFNKDAYSQYLGYSSDLQNGRLKEKALIQYIRAFERKRCRYNFFLPDAMKDSLYFAWLMKDIFVAKENPLPLLSHIKSLRLQQLLNYLLTTDAVFPRILQSFLEKEVLCAQKKLEVEALFTLYHTCLNYLAAHIQSSRERDCVLKLYAQYKVMAKYYILKYHQFRHIFLSYQEETTLFYYNQAYLRYTSKQFPFRLSICMTVRDQETELKRCLASLRPLLAYDFTELIIVDTGSCDRTVSVASSYTLNVYFNTENEDPVQSRNKSILYARGEYLMFLNANESLSALDCKKLINYIRSYKYLHYCTYNLNITDTNETTQIEPRIFKNDGTIYYTTSTPDSPTHNSNSKDLDITIQKNIK
ncbi:MAG: glycosyltransferase family 2 protein [Clostridiales bacterium]|nr:glycosyltransferase family 2 protein [Clostridiales bacterium]